MEILSCSSSSESEGNNKWNITYYQEKAIWKKDLIGQYIYEQKICPSFKSYSLNLHETQTENVLNPYFLRCIKKNEGGNLISDILVFLNCIEQ